MLRDRENNNTRYGLVYAEAKGLIGHDKVLFVQKLRA